MIAAESVIPDLTQDKLLALTRWIGSAPGFALTYPNLENAGVIQSDARVA